jgi:hypothetical protein
VKRVAGSRGDHVGLLRTRPVLDHGAEPVDTPVSPRRVDELRLLLQLVDRGLLSEEELDLQLISMFGARTWTSARDDGPSRPPRHGS